MKQKESQRFNTSRSMDMIMISPSFLPLHKLIDDPLLPMLLMLYYSTFENVV